MRTVAIRLDALAAVGADTGCVHRSGRQVQPIAFRQLEIPFAGVENDRPAEAEQHLVLVVLVPGISVPRAVRPRSWRPTSVHPEGGERLLARRRARCQFRSHERGIVPLDLDRRFDLRDLDEPVIAPDEHAFADRARAAVRIARCVDTRHHV